MRRHTIERFEVKQPQLVEEDLKFSELSWTKILNTGMMMLKATFPYSAMLSIEIL